MDGSTQIATTQAAGLPAVPAGTDPFSSYGAKVGQQGTFLTFKNGEFLFGQNGDELPIGTKLAANVGGLRVGWKRWFAGAVTDDMLELLVDQKPLQPRNSLGDMDPQMWERDEKTKEPRDPWQFTNELTLVDGDGETYIYATASKGGIGAIGRLCKVYGKEYRQRPGMVPIVELATDFYMHKDYGKTYFPIFNLVDWVSEEELLASGAADEGGGSDERAVATEPATPAAAAAHEPAPKTAPAAPAPRATARKARF